MNTLTKALAGLMVGAGSLAFTPAPSQAGVRVDIDFRDGHRHDVPDRVWVEPVYRTVCDSVWVDATYRTVADRVWHDADVRPQDEQIYVPARYEMQDVRRWDGRGWRNFREAVLIEPAHYETRHQDVAVHAGYWEDVTRQVLVTPGHYENVERQELVAPGHWEYAGGHWDHPGRW